MLYNLELELLLESFEIIEKASEDSQYILTDKDNLTYTELKNKIQIRRNRILNEIGNLNKIIDNCFTEGGI